MAHRYEFYCCQNRSLVAALMTNLDHYRNKQLAVANLQAERARLETEFARKLSVGLSR